MSTLVLYLALFPILGCFSVLTVIYFAGLLRCMEKYGFIQMLCNKGNTSYNYNCMRATVVVIQLNIFEKAELVYVKINSENSTFHRFLQTPDDDSYRQLQMLLFVH